ncbi:MAG: Lrp/AsnC ligand binding domain-containing protein [Nanoarchaeota archaeon]|nr:Lrp/AsnC ligand binding domain-containing protein [Nanoarchaeota archaeon]MBU1623192.1 Lrp/AsnC ligand binding domain-containing protein [Nanoarchaeota archaeon]MBU1974476.1 Lrp/AsnC ligand binding domain-containing protein [Nanoarchaeota archaeon]
MKAFVQISLKEGNERRLVRELQSYSQIRNTYLLFGEWDIMAEIEMSSAEELATFVLEKIRSRPDVRLTSSLIVAGQ